MIFSKDFFIKAINLLNTNWKTSLASVAATVFTVWQTIPDDYRLHLLNKIEHFSISGQSVDIDIKPFSITGSNELEVLQQKLEMNFAKLFSSHGHTVQIDGGKATSPLILSGKITQSEAGNIVVTVLLKSANGTVIGSSEVEGPHQELRSLYHTLPEALFYKMGVSPDTLGATVANHLSTNSALAYAHFLQAQKESFRRSNLTAQDELSRAIEIDSSFALAYWALAELKRIDGHKEEAKQLVEIAQDIDPDHARIAVITSQDLKLIPISSANVRNITTENGQNYIEACYNKYDICMHIWSFDSRLFTFRLSAIDELHYTGQTAQEFLTRKEDLLAVNGGYFEKDRNSRDETILSPSGLLISDKKLFADVSQKGGSGILYINNSCADIVRRNEFNSNEVTDAVQAGPILVEHKNKIGVYKNDFNRQRRSAVCLNKNFIIYIIVDGEVSLFELAELLQANPESGGLGCVTALNLDGGPSTQAYFNGKNLKVDIKGLWRIHNAIVISRR